MKLKRDENSRHVLEADEAIDLGSMEEHTLNPFLNMELLVKTALAVGSHAIHPGYGYLSENPAFADCVRAHGMIFVGPSSSAMSMLGDKRRSKEYLAAKAPHVPLIPGFTGSSLEVRDLQDSAKEIGFPIMLKASAGGGGKGMRIVWEASQLADELARVQSEAENSFGSKDCILEKFIEKSKHIEIQVIGDSHGNVLSFWERDCSIQRRHQKLVEETPCAFLTEHTREKMSNIALEIAGLIGYDNAGTIEFVIDVETSQFFFLEVNARLQVEHPISEEVTRTDLVALQLFVAAGGNLKDLPELQRVPQLGHAIECRLYAEDPAHDFLPQHGTVHLWKPSSSYTGPKESVRYETALSSGVSISIYFDSMIAKVVVWAPTRAAAIKKMLEALANLACVGVKTNQLFLQHCLMHPEFRDRRYTTSLIPQNLEQLLQSASSQKGKLAEAIIPSLIVRNFHHIEKSKAGIDSPFVGVRQNFRTQRYDPVNVNGDIIISSQSGEAVLCLWKSEVPISCLQSGSIQIVQLPQINSPEDRRDAGGSAAYQYNLISNILRQQRHEEDEEALVTPFKLHTFELVPQSTHTGMLPAFVEVSLDGSRFSAYCLVADKSYDWINQPQEILCHFPHQGQWARFHRHTLLSYSETRRVMAHSANEAEENEIKAPMPCKVLSIEKKNGDTVEVGDIVMIIESMKMEISIKAKKSGFFETEWVSGDPVEEGKVLGRVV